MQRLPLTATASAIRLPDRKHTRIIGGSAETDEKALTVAPWQPAEPSVVTTATELATRRMVRTNESRANAVDAVVMMLSMEFLQLCCLILSDSDILS